NVWVGSTRELMTLAHAAKKTYVTVEKIIDDDLYKDKLRAPATIPNLYISGIAEVEKGAWPLGQPYEYNIDEPHLENYVRQAATPEGFAEYLASNVTMENRNAAE
ncbi:MAG: CoA synthetase, partial [Alphaproteobacteria bacterium]|nr:CoA synthetase [Alphaproteobacteria bacterium]